MKKLFFLLLMCAFVTLSSHAATKSLTVYFDKGSYTLSQSEQAKLQTLKYAGLVCLTAHTDKDGSFGSNMILSEKRVDFVRKQLLGIGISELKIRTAFKGELIPVNRADNEPAKAQNRRVEITYNDDPFSRHIVPVLSNEINNNLDTTLTLGTGISVEIPANAFGGGTVSIKSRAFNNALDILSENLTTTSGKLPIETAGMLYIEASKNGRGVQPQKDLTYQFETKKDVSGFQYFQGNEDTALKVDWQAKPGGDTKTPSLKQARLTKGDSTNYVYKASSVRLYAALDSSVNLALKPRFDKVLEALKALNPNVWDDLRGRVEICIKVNEDGLISSIFDESYYANPELFRKVRGAFAPYFNGRLTSREIPKSRKIHVTVHHGGDTYTLYSSRGSTYSSLYSYQMVIPPTERIALNTMNLGWINCDRFYHSGQVLGNLTVKADEFTSVKMILIDERSFFSTYTQRNNIFQFSSIPVGSKAYIIASKTGDNGEIYFSSKEVTIENQAIEINPLKKMTEAEMENALLSLAL